MHRFFCFVLLLLTLGCSNKYLSIQKEYVDRSSLASSFTKSPDPMQKNPPIGRRLWIDWDIPGKDWEEGLFLSLRVVFNNYQEERVTYPITTSKGYLHYDLLGEKFIKTGGLLTYMAEISNIEGKILARWQHQMWFNLIDEE